MLPLTDADIFKTVPRERSYRLFDGQGLYLEITPNGSRYWRLKYHFNGKEKRLAIGVYPRVTCDDARHVRYESKRMLANGVDPGEHKRLAKRSQHVAATSSFSTVAIEWLAKQHFAPRTLEKAEWTFNDLLFPYLGARPAGDITAPELLGVLQRIEARGKHETAHRTKQRAGQVFRYAIATGRSQRDPSADLRGALTPVRVTNRAAITDPRRAGELLRTIDGYSGDPSTEAALRLAPLVFTRPGELRAAEWSEIDFAAAQWRIPALRMKMRQQHIVPLSRQAVVILTRIQPLTGRGQFVFPGIRTPMRPISENTLGAALRRLGYSKDEMTAHGFRAMASTLLNEQGFPPEVIELQLAHAERNQVRAAYNRAQRLLERKNMMQAWADYLDELKADRRSRDASYA